MGNCNCCGVAKRRENGGIEQQQPSKPSQQAPDPGPYVIPPEPTPDPEPDLVPPPEIPSKIASQMEPFPRYKLERGLGRGGYGFVALARDTQTGLKVAIKYLERITVAADSDEARWKETKVRITREILYHKMLTGHPNIVDFKELFLLPSYLCVVMEYARGGTLHTYVNRRYMQGNPMKEHEVRVWFQQLMYAISRIKTLNIVNRDIKLENCLIQKEKGGDEVLKLCDFGFAKHMERDSAPFTKAGSRPYIAPEVLFPRNFQEIEWQKRDIWSCGVMLYSMLFGRYPFDPKRYRNQLEFYNDLKTARFDFPTRPEVSDEVKILIKNMLIADPVQRFGLQEVIENVWFQTDLVGPPPVVDESIKDKMQSDEEINGLIDDAFRRVELEMHSDEIIDDILVEDVDDNDEDFADIELR